MSCGLATATTSSLATSPNSRPSARSWGQHETEVVVTGFEPAHARGGPAEPRYGVYLARVESTQDPNNLARVQVRILSFDGLQGQDGPIWARVAVPFAGSGRGAFMIPSQGDEVAIQFVGGDVR